MNSSKKRNIKWQLDLADSPLVSQLKGHNKTLNDLSRQVFQDLNSGRLSNIHVRGGGDKKDVIYDGKPTTKSTLKDIYRPIFELNGWAPKIEAFKTDSLEHVL